MNILLKLSKSKEGWNPICIYWFVKNVSMVQ
jgi:hypothetical protein